MINWIEFKRLNGNQEIYPTSIRVYGIEGVDKISDGTTRIYMDDEHNYSYTIAEPYEEVMEKIRKAEEPTVIPFVEHFTREEYELLLDAVKGLEGYEKIQQTIKGILEEYK